VKTYLNFGRERFRLSIEDGNFLGSLKPNIQNIQIDEKHIINSALLNPIKSTLLKNFIKKNEKVLIVIPDKTRLSRLKIVMPVLLNEIKQIGVEQERIGIIFANGSHLPQTEEDKITLIGKKKYISYKIFEHNAFDFEQMYYFGKTSFGTPIYLNKIIKEYDKIITIAAVSHHYFAGFGGGAKMILPGLAHHSTIKVNHKRSICKNKLNDKCKSGELKGNPIYEDLSQVVKYCPPIFSINLVLNEKGKIILAKTGNIIEAHKKITNDLNKLYRIKIDELADLVICSCGGYPKDINIIQTHKTIYNAFQAVKKGGVIICFAECIDGIGSDTLLKWFDVCGEKLKNLESNYTLNTQTAVSIQDKSKQVKIILISKLKKTLVKKMNLVPASNFEEAIKIAKKVLPIDYKYYIIKNSSLILPYFNRS
jgi:nickel-dependent lactate racemase